MITIMKKKIFIVLAAAAVATLAVTGCVQTVSDTDTFALTPGRDSVSGRYQRSVDQVYQAAKTVISRDGVMVKEYVPHEYTNTVLQLQGRVNDRNVWVRVEQVDPRVSQVDVEARSKYGTADVDLVHELEKEIALELAAH